MDWGKRYKMKENFVRAQAKYGRWVNRFMRQ